MTIQIQAQGAERKRLVQTISDWLGVPAKYCGTPTFSYTVDGCTIEKDGSLSIDDSTDRKWCDKLVKHIRNCGFDVEQTVREEPQNVCISIPRCQFTDKKLENLKRLLEIKGGLIKSALCVDAIPIEITETAVSFPWFAATVSADELLAYDLFIRKLCALVWNQKRVNASERIYDNEKYAFRCFLLRLGFIGKEYKTAREILLRSLSGSSAFRDGHAREKKVCG